MNYRLLFLLYLLGLGLFRSQVVLAKPIWTFSIVVAVEKQTANFYQAMLSKPIDQIVKAQIETVNANFNSAVGFKGTYNFRVDSIYVFDGLAASEVFRAHPRFNYGVVIDGFSVNSTGGGWYGDYKTIYHKWSWSNDFASGPFGSGATDGLTHEFGHSRGAIDIYGLRVEGAKNPVNTTTFEPVSSVMNYPYGNIVWDEYTTNLLNSTADNLIEDEQWITRPFPRTIGIKAINVQGMGLENAKIEVYPVDWFSYSVTATPILTAYTDSKGTYDFGSNPYKPETINYPWHIRYANFLIKATYNSVVAYKWMPLYDVQNAYFRNGTDSVYQTELVFPASTPTINLTTVNVTHSCPGNTLQVTFSPSGSFGADNQFILMFVDKSNNSYGIGTLTGNGGGTISGKAPYLTPGEYKLRIVSSNPSAQSNAYPIILDAAPAKPGVQSLSVCQNATVPALQAIGQNLNWYGMDGASLPTAPTPNTSKSGTQFYYVTQTIDGCQSDLAVIQVVVQAPPTLSISGTTTATIGMEVPLKLGFTGASPYSYTLSSGLAGTASHDTTLLVLPDRTTTYQGQQVSNRCGTGVAVGSGATITLLVPHIQTLPFSSLALCGGTSFTVSYQTSGAFNPGNVFKLQLAKVATDSASASFSDLTTTQLTPNIVSATISIGTPAGSYWLRVVATNPKIPILGTISPTVLTILAQPTATLAANQTIVAGQAATLVVSLTGNSPWTFTYRDSTASGIGSSQSVQATTSPYMFTVKPLQTTVYALKSVSNGCGSGSITGGLVTVSVSPLLGTTQEELLTEVVDVFPVPATTSLTIQLRKKQPAELVRITLMRQTGQPLIQRETNADQLILLMSFYAADSYILQIQVGDRIMSKRIVKY